MRKVERNELLGLADYETIRDRFRSRIIAEKRERRVVVSDELSILFESHDTALLQIQEMLRTERISGESAVLHELETYNELVPGENELSATIFVEIAEAEVRDRRLIDLAGLEACFSLDVLGTTVRGRNETRGVLPDRTTAVHYVKFPIGADLARRLLARVKEDPSGVLSFVVDHPKLALKTAMPSATVALLSRDLSE